MLNTSVDRIVDYSPLPLAEQLANESLSLEQSEEVKAGFTQKSIIPPLNSLKMQGQHNIMICRHPDHSYVYKKAHANSNHPTIWVINE